MQYGTTVKKLTTLAMLSAIAAVMVAVSSQMPPVVLFLKYDPKDIIIVIGGFLYGPLAALAVSAVSSLIEMITVGQTGYIGLIMNIVSSCAFACPAALIYKKKRKLSSALIGLAIGIVSVTIVMSLWNYLLTPIYMEQPRSDIAKMILPTFIPFNLIKGGINAAIAILIYSPIRIALIKSRLIPKPESTMRKKINIGTIVSALFVIITCILWILVINKII